MICSAITCYYCRAERASFEENQHILAKKLTDKTVSECRLQDQCDILQKRQTDIEAALDRREVELEAVVSQLEIEQRQCNEYKLEMVQLTADLKTAEGHKDSLDSQVTFSNSRIHGHRNSVGQGAMAPPLFILTFQGATVGCLAAFRRCNHRCNLSIGFF